MADAIQVENARVHNLKGISVDIPRNQVVAFTGVSGSGKSSLVFDTLHTEAQRQLIETFSSFSRRYLPKLSRPDVDEIRNLSTSIVIDQKRLGRTLRSTVGTATEVYTYLRMLFSRCGDGEGMASFHFSFNVPPGWCPACLGLGKRIRIDTDLLFDRSRSLRDGAVTHPDWKVGGWGWTELIHCPGCSRPQPLGRRCRHSEAGARLPDRRGRERQEHARPEVVVPLIESAVVVDQTPIGVSSRANPATYLGIFDEIRRLFARETGQPASLFSFNSSGACPTCKGLGSIGVEMNFLDAVRIDCADCEGRRYRPDVLELRWHGFGIDDVLHLTASDALDAFAEEPRIRPALELLDRVGLGYVTLGQPLSTLSGGECQRIKLATELGKTGNVYILDEPTTGLHLSDIDRLMGIVERLVDDGNSVIVIEHNLQVIARADWVIDLGPEGGSRGGRVLFVGTPEDLVGHPGSHTGRYLGGELLGAAPALAGAAG